MDRVEVHQRVTVRHPNLSVDDVRFAWRHFYYEALRPESPNFPEYLRLGVDSAGREVEMIGVLTEVGWLVYHANTPVSKRVRREIERQEGRR